MDSYTGTYRKELMAGVCGIIYDTVQRSDDITVIKLPSFLCTWGTCPTPGAVQRGEDTAVSKRLPISW